MDPRRVSRTVSDPKVRHVGFFAPPAPPERSQSGPPDPTSSSPPVSGIFSPGNSLSPYNPSDFLSPSATTDCSDDPLSPRLSRMGSSGKFAMSLPSDEFDMPVAKLKDDVTLPPNVSDGGANMEVQKEKRAAGGKPLKDKTTKAERRAIQEAQRAAKAAAKGEGSKASAAAATRVNPTNTGKPGKADAQKKDNSTVTASEKKGGDRQPDKDRKKDTPHPRMQFDDENRVEKAKKRSVVKQTEARNRVELFRHLPQYEHGTRLPELESKFFN
ncbi:UNVERIFIED_CONTAM: hypothetical protein Sangu_0160400 [Sesamum angustifolium]|uniref:Uncharacterized protein n=1 Tax=Sesamum angustifolium TaxID=2727405 RepID=A0AAW2RLD3_9LAMI